MLRPSASIDPIQRERDGAETMGKLLALLLALADLGLLVLLLTSGEGNMLREAGLVTSILLVGAIAWVTAFFTAIYSAFRFGRDWRWILILLAFIWLPALPVLAYSGTQLYPLFGRKRQSARSRWTLPGADPALRIGRTSRRQRSNKLLGSGDQAA